MASTIGIKIANGEFYSIVEENSSVKKRLVLTTAHDRQRSVQIDLYKSHTHTMADALYIGSLVMENIKPRPKGEPSIELVIASTENGDITADAIDLDPSVHGEHQTLNVSLRSLDDSRELEIPDFELESAEVPPAGLYEKANAVRNREEKQGFPWLVVVCAALIIAAIGLALWLLLFRGGRDTETVVSRPEVSASAEVAGSQSPASRPVQVPPEQPAPVVQTPVQPAEAPPPEQPSAAPVIQTPAPVQPEWLPPATPVVQTPPPVIEAPVKAPSAAPVRRERRSPPVASYKVPSVIPKGGALYTIRWGDTLWDIAEAFYRNPWQYPRIARFNNIRNPDFIISGTRIRVPPRN